MIKTLWELMPLTVKAGDVAIEQITGDGWEMDECDFLIHLDHVGWMANQERTDGRIGAVSIFIISTRLEEGAPVLGILCYEIDSQGPQKYETEFKEGDDYLTVTYNEIIQKLLTDYTLDV